MILVIGGTGTIGRHVLDGLRTRDDVRALSRTEESAQTLHDAGAREVVRGDLAEPGTLGAAFDGVRRVFLLSGFSHDQVALELNAIVAAERSGVAEVVKLSGLAAGYGIAMATAHETVEARLAVSNVRSLCLRPANFMQNFLRQASTIAEGRLIAPSADGREAFVNARDVAAAVVTALVSDDMPTGIKRLLGPQDLTYEEVASIFSDTLGRQVTYVDVPDEQWREGALAGGLPEFYADALLELYVWQRSVPTPEKSDLGGLLGRKPSSLAEFARETLAPAIARLEQR